MVVNFLIILYYPYDFGNKKMTIPQDRPLERRMNQKIGVGFKTQRPLPLGPAACRFGSSGEHRLAQRRHHHRIIHT